jgi:hypothetical protein
MKHNWLVILFVLLSFCSCTNRGNKLYVVFNRVDGLTEGSMVSMNGMNAGTVKSLNIYNNKVIALLEINPLFKVPDKSQFFADNNQLSNSKVIIEIIDSNNYLKNGDTVTGIFREHKFLDGFLSDSTIKIKIKKSLDKIIEVADSLKKGLRDSAKIKKVQ